MDLVILAISTVNGEAAWVVLFKGGHVYFFGLLLLPNECSGCWW
jgi:hypothetical protein